MAELSRLGRYELSRVLGRGAMGVVYEGLDPVLSRRVAVKTILTSIAVDADTERAYSERFIREAKAVARLNHPNIVQVYDFGVEGEIAYLVMEFIEGRELRSYFEAKEKFDTVEAVRIMGELLDALHFAHEAGVIHRDVKPANVMLDAQRRVKLADFGVARIQDDAQRTKADTMVGTPAFMSPEQISGVKVDRRTDIFSAGTILYQLLSGEKPFKGGGAWTVVNAILNTDPPPLSAIVPSVSPLFDPIVNKALAKKPEERFSNAQEFAAALRGALGKVAASETSKQPTELSRRGSEAEVEFWRSIQNSSDPAEFEVYIDEFPDGTYSQLARIKLARLREPVEAARAKAVADETTVVMEQPSAPPPQPPVAPVERKKPLLIPAIAAAVAIVGGIGVYLLAGRAPAPAPVAETPQVRSAEAPAPPVAVVDMAQIQRETEERVRKEFEDKAAAERAAMEKAASEKAAAERVAAEKLAQAKIAQEKAQQAKAKAEAEKAAAEKAATEKAAAEKVAAERAAAEKAAAEKAVAEKLAAQKILADKAAAKKAAAVRAAAETAAAQTAAVARAAGETQVFANEDRDWGVEPTSTPRLKPLHAPTPRSIPGAKVLTTMALKNLLDTNKTVVVVDVLESASRSTVPGAYWIPGAGQGRLYGAEKERFAAALQKLTSGNRNRPLVFLCLSAECWLSYNAALHALEAGYPNVSWYRGGTDAWIGAGFARRKVERVDW